MVTIETDRLIIRLAELDDAEAIYSYRSDVIENRYQGWFPGSVEEVRVFIQVGLKVFHMMMNSSEPSFQPHDYSMHLRKMFPLLPDFTYTSFGKSFIKGVYPLSVLTTASESTLN